MTDLTAQALHPQLRTRHFGRQYRHFAAVDSTQTEAVAAARAGAPEGAAFVAEAQTSGRGRHGHRWESAPGDGIYCSLILRTPPARLLAMMLAAGLGLADAVAACGVAEPEIRWPNDLLLGGRKFCGVLVETFQDTGRPGFAVLGFGINVRQREFDGELAPIATSLWREGFDIDRGALLAECLLRLETRYLDLAESGPAPVLAEFERRSRYARGLQVRVGQGDEAFTGTTAGLDACGFLRVETAGEMRTVMSGQVRPV